MSDFASMKLRRWLGIAVLLCALSGRSQQIFVNTTDLPDTVVGQDLWRYTYSLIGFNFQAGQGFSVFFNYQLYTNLSNPQPAASPDWNAIAVQPDLILNQDGYYDALASINAPSLAGTFSVDVIWLGQGLPGTSQPFYTYDVNFQPLITGVTTEGAVPEPGSIFLSFLGAGVLWAGARKRFRSFNK